MIDIIGLTFGRWTVLSRPKTRKYKWHVAYNCQCQCGTRRLVSGSLLQRGETLSCGCLTRERSSQLKHKHGLSRHRLVGSWRSMKQRCYNKKCFGYSQYGGRGIIVCKRWHKIENFVADNEEAALPGLTLDRIDNDGPYSPQNCRWVTPKQQTRNRRNNLLLTFNGRTLPCSEWAELLSLSEKVLRMRLHLNWPIKKALTHPVRVYRK